MKPKTQLIVGVGGLLAVLAAFTTLLAIPFFTGTTVMLATAPVDPWDLFRGQYIWINYEISTMPMLANAHGGDTVYVSLKVDGNGIARFVQASRTMPEGLFIKGTVMDTGAENMRVSYPSIEQYFTERDSELPRGTLTVEIKLTKSGAARISRLFIDGKPAELEYREPRLTS